MAKADRRRDVVGRMGRTIYAYCRNCKWTWRGGEKLLTSERDSVRAMSDLNRFHRQQQLGPVDKPGCQRPNIVLSLSNGGDPVIPTYFCLICNTTTLIPHVCSLFERKTKIDR